VSQAPPFTLPGDPLCRHWVELTSANPHLTHEFRPTLVTIYSSSYSREPGIAGTGFVIASDENFVVIATAKHVLEYLPRIQNPYNLSGATSPFKPVAQLPDLQKGKVKIVFANDEIAGMFDVVYACINESTDIAICIAEVQKEFKKSIRSVTVPLDLTTPKVGEIVHVASLVHPLKSIEVTETEQGILNFAIERKVDIRRGVVTGVHMTGFRQYKWPCFTTSIPVQFGMSGGFVYIPRDGATVSACGVVCVEVSQEIDPTSYNSLGESVMGCGWTALALRLPNTLPQADDKDTSTIFSMMQNGSFPMASNGIGHIRFEEGQNGDAKIGLVAQI